MEILRGRGFQKPNFLKESMELKWNFQRGWGVQVKKPSVRGVWIYYGATHCTVCVQGYFNWKEDSNFGRQRVQGCNPTLLRLCTEIPEK